MLKLFSGTAHPKLSQEVSKLLKLPLSKSEVVRFGNSEVRVRISENVRNSTCIVIQPAANPTDTNYMELFFFCDALRRQEAKKVIGVIPYFGYAKQNIQHRSGESVSVNVIIRFLESIGFEKIYAFDLHDEATAGVFSIPFKHLSAFPLSAKHIRNYFLKSVETRHASSLQKHVALVSPDQGAVEKVRHFGRFFFQTENFSEVVIEKKRDQDVMHKAKPLDLYGDVKNKIALIVDDMVVSGSTVLPAIDLCLKRGAKKVYFAAIHHDFTKEAPRLLQNSRLERFFTTNTIELKPTQKFPKLEEISVASLIANELKSI
ncbi:ribose-phosphate pyrophosphokinase [Candidatus Roizmanbacteria bacterium]|nr:ribose-phosphate pyrophosphokinase [Candidatus Roizmanbacteria bacterium]